LYPCLEGFSFAYEVSGSSIGGSFEGKINLFGWLEVALFVQGCRITLIKSNYLICSLILLFYYYYYYFIIIIIIIFLSLFPIPIVVANCREKLQRDFLLGGVDDEFKFHLVSRSKICSPISLCGWGLGTCFFLTECSWGSGYGIVPRRERL
jgi:hypothetical protein